MDAPLPPCLSLVALGTLSAITALVAPRPLRPCAAVGHSAFLLIPSCYLPALLPSPPPPVLATALWFLFPPGGGRVPLIINGLTYLGGVRGRRPAVLLPRSVL